MSGLPEDTYPGGESDPALPPRAPDANEPKPEDTRESVKMLAEAVHLEIEASLGGAHTEKHWQNPVKHF